MNFAKTGDPNDPDLPLGVPDPETPRWKVLDLAVGQSLVPKMLLYSIFFRPRTDSSNVRWARGSGDGFAGSAPDDRGAS